MKYIAAFILTVLLSPMLFIWFLFDIASDDDNTITLLNSWWRKRY